MLEVTVRERGEDEEVTERWFLYARKMHLTMDSGSLHIHGER